MQILADRLALWFLRLNGFMTIANFIVHPEGPREDGAYPQRTDVDVLGVRFPFRTENRLRPMPDHDWFTSEQRRVMVVLSEVTVGGCKVNGPWTNPELQNMEKVLFAGGFRPAVEVDAIAAALYTHGIWEDAKEDSMVIRIVCFGGRHNSAVGRQFPRVPQLIWSQHVLPFVYQRFTDYHLEKRMHNQWEADARDLFMAANVARAGTGIDEFVQAVQVVDRL